MTLAPDATTNFTLTLPMNAQAFWVAVGFIALIALTGAIYLFAKLRPGSPHPAGRPRDWVGILLTTFAPVGLAVTLLILWHMYVLLATLPSALAAPDQMRSYAAAFGGLTAGLGALIAVAFGLVRVQTTERQTRTAEQGHITERISKAVEQLGAEKTVKKVTDMPRYQKDGSGWRYDEQGHLIPALAPDGTPLVDHQTHESTVPNIEVRIGGLYALERIAQDSMTNDGGRDHIRIMELLCAYVRENAPASGAASLPDGDFRILGLPALPQPRTDIQTALTIIGRRTGDQIALEKKTVMLNSDQGYQLDLRATCLQRANLARLRLAGAHLDIAHMQGALLTEADMEGASLVLANLQGAWMQGTWLNEARLNGADLRSADLTDCKMARASLRSVDLTGAIGLTQTQVNAAWGDGVTTLPDLRVPIHWDDELAYIPIKGDTNYRAWLASGAPPGQPRA